MDVGVWQIYRKVHVKVAGAQRSCAVIGPCLCSALMPTEARQRLHALGRHSAATLMRAVPRLCRRDVEKRPEVSGKKVD